MITAESGTSIDRPVDDVFAYVADTTNDPVWHLDVLHAKRRGEGPTHEGSEFDIRIKPFMGQSGGSLRVTRFESNQLLELSGRMGPLEPTIQYTFRATDGSTEVRRAVRLQPPGLMRLLQPLMRPTIAKRNSEFLGNLKRVLEGL